MKKLFIVLLFVPLFSFGQSESNVDKIKGFKSLKLADNKSIYEKNLKFIRSDGKYSIYQYIDDIELTKYRTTSKQSLRSIALMHNISIQELKAFNPQSITNRKKIKKNINVVIPIIKPINQELLYLFDKKHNYISLIFDDKTSKLASILLDFTEDYEMTHLLSLPIELQNLYNNFTREIGTASEPRNINSASFYELASGGKILWLGNEIVLKISTNYEYKIKPNGTTFIHKLESVSFMTKNYWNETN